MFVGMVLVISCLLLLWTGCGTTNITENTISTTGNITLGGDLNSAGGIKISSSSQCIMMRDTDDGGWTKCTVLNGVMSCITDADGIC